MNYTLFLGCNIPARVTQYQSSAMAVCDALNIKLRCIDEFVCCGYPMRNIDEFTFLLSAARNMAMAESRGSDLMVLCKCYYGSLKMAQYQLRRQQNKLNKINIILKKCVIFSFLET